MRVLIMQERSKGKIVKVFEQSQEGRKARREWLEQSDWDEDQLRTKNAAVHP